MDRLILLRHGKAETDATSGHDVDRALTDRGRSDVLSVCRAMAEAGIEPELVLISPATRALQTWDAASAVFSRAEHKIVPALYEVGPAEILNIARVEGREARAVMVIGHNPGLGALSARLARDVRAPAEMLARIGMGFPTAASSVTQFDPPAFALYTPKGSGERG
jgi:phosphohistidine phosphatase